MNRRHFLIGAGALAAAGSPRVHAQTLSDVENSLRGSIPATDFGVRPDALDDQSAAFARMLETDGNMPIFLPPGTYTVSNILLPPRLRLTGIPGRTRILFGGDGRCLYALDGEDVALSGITVDGGNRLLSEDAVGLVDLRGIAKLVIDECEIVGSAGNGLAIERSGGRIERSTVAGAAEAGIYCVQSSGMRISGNTVSDCGNGGILVHRWEAGPDGTLVTENRVERIAARNGGTGQYGNGINLYRADNVIVANNHVTDCAFSAIRVNSASDIQIVSNNCARSGETGIYSEFAFQGAAISANVVDGAANGISMVNFDQGGRMAVCNGNIVRNLSRAGPYKADPPGFGVGINVEADSTVSANVIEDAPTFGMAIGWGPFMRNVVATGNVVRKVGTGIAVSVVEGVGAAVISDNIIQDAAAGGIVGYRWAEAVTGDLAEDGAEGFPNLTIRGNQVG
jgi:uncharacterized secreted repeat protein (TIGR03808 family)